jgi:hypothetical protein
MKRDDLMETLLDKAAAVLGRRELAVRVDEHDDGFFYVRVSGGTHSVEQRIDPAPFLSLTDDAAPAAVEMAVMDMRPEFGRTFAALREG